MTGWLDLMGTVWSWAIPLATALETAGRKTLS